MAATPAPHPPATGGAATRKLLVKWITPRGRRRCTPDAERRDWPMLGPPCQPPIWPGACGRAASRVVKCADGVFLAGGVSRRLMSPV